MIDCNEWSGVLAALERRDLLRQGSRKLLAHVAACESCQSKLRDRGQGIEAGVVASDSAAFKQRRGAVPKESYSRALDNVFRSMAHEQDEIERQRLTVPGLLAELSTFSPGRQKLLVRNSVRYQVWALAEALLVRCREGWAEDPSGCEELAHLALEVADFLTVEGFRRRLLNDLRAEAWSYVANCRRIRSDYFEAQRAFQIAEGFLAEGSGDRVERARVLDLKASLLGDRGDFHEADRLLTEAISEYRAAKDKHLEGRALMKKAKHLRERGRVEEAIPVLERAARLVDVAREPWLLFVLKRNLMGHLLEVGRGEDAQVLLPEARELAREHASRLDRLRLLWTEGLLCKALGQVELAIEVLKQVRDGFIGAEIGHDVALVSLDLATLYLDAGRTEEVRKLAAESVPLFASRGVHREVVVAWRLFREAAEREAVTLRLVEKLAARIRQAEPRRADAGETP